MNRQQRRNLERKTRKQGTAAGSGGPETGPEADFAAAARHHKAGRLAEAQAGYRRVLAVRPRHAPALHNLGLIAHQLGDQETAVDLVGKAIAVDGATAAFHNTHGNVLKAMGNLVAAIAGYRRAIAAEPGYAEAHLNLGEALSERGEIDAAVASYGRAIDIAPDFAEAHNNLGHALQDRGDIDTAIESYRRALALRPGEAEWHNNLGHALHEAGRFEDAVTSLRHALALDPTLAEAHNNLGNAYKDAGRFDDARAAYRRAIEVRPTYAEAYYNLANLSRAKPGDPTFSKLEALKGDAALPFDEAICLRFALGKMYADIGENDTAFEEYRLGNELRALAAARHGRRFDIERHHDRISRIIALHSAEFFADRRDFGAASDLPVLIVGMPRSGTTLVEQILASHPNVAGGGELPYLGRIATAANLPYADFMADLDRAGSRRLGDLYLDHLRAISATAARITDKMPDNFLLLGMATVILPGARVIHCLRDPLDTCLSCYFQHFTRGHEFANDLASLGAYHREYRRLMAHWRAVLPLAPLDVSYEDLVANQEEVSRRIVDFCGLEWNDACLEFHRNARPVHTASNVQVRQPMFSTSVARWRAFAKHLGPLKAALGDPG